MRVPVSIRQFMNVEGTQLLVRATCWSNTTEEGSPMVMEGDGARWDIVATDVDDNIVASWNISGYDADEAHDYIEQSAQAYIRDRLYFIANNR